MDLLSHLCRGVFFVVFIGLLTPLVAGEQTGDPAAAFAKFNIMYNPQQPPPPYVFPEKENINTFADSPSRLSGTASDGEVVCEGEEPIGKTEDEYIGLCFEECVPTWAELCKTSRQWANLLILLKTGAV